MIKVGLLGLGMIGKIHLNEGYNKLDKEKVSLDACFDMSEEALSITGDTRKYTNLDDFFENEKGRLDCVDICLPTFMHTEIAIKAMEYGFDVLCEKPMALSSEDAQKMCDVSLKTGKKLMIAHVLRFDEDYMTIKEYIDSEILGKVKNVKYTTFRKGVPGGFNNWFKNSKLSGGPIVDVHIHDTDALIWFFNMPKSVSTIAPKKSEDGCYDSFSTNLEYEDDFIVNIQCDFSLPVVKHDRSRSIRIIFEKGYIIKNSDSFTAVDENGNETDLTLKRSINYYPDAMYYNEIKYFTDCLHNNTQFLKCLPEDSFLSTKLIELEITSADKKGEKVFF